MSDNGVWATSPERFHLAQAYHQVAEVIGWDRAVDFGMKVWELKRPPSRCKSDPVHGGGYGHIYIPKALTRFAGGELVRLAGRDAAELLVAAFPGLCLEFPCVVSASIARRNRAIAQQVAEGRRAIDVAWSFDLTERQVRRIVKRETIRHGV